MKRYPLIIFLLVSFTQTYVNAKPLIIVADKGGVSATGYYQELGLTADTLSQPQVITPTLKPGTEADMLPVHSELLTPGTVVTKTISAPGLTPIFLIGTDELSKRWLRYRHDELIKLQAIGFVVNVENAEELAQLKAIVPELTFKPISGDDIAQRLMIQHYPVLITANSIEQ